MGERMTSRMGEIHNAEELLEISEATICPAEGVSINRDCTSSVSESLYMQCIYVRHRKLEE